MENSKIRIGKDFNVFWAIHKIVDGQRQPYDLEGKKLQLYYRTSYGKVEVANWKVNSNSIEWRFRGKEQKYVDDYELILVENADQDGMVTVDTCNAFTLVAHSCEERINEAENIIIEVVTLESDVALAPVVKEVGGGASEEDIQEIKNDIVDLQLKDVQTDAKLTELSAEIKGKEDKANKTTTLSSASTDTQYPSARAAFMAINKKSEVSLETLANGNLKVTIDGVSKDFMAATPSGDPMHYNYIVVGALYNDTDSAIARTDYFDNAVSHLPGRWYVEGLGDLTNAEMREVYEAGKWWESSSQKGFGAQTKARALLPSLAYQQVTYKTAFDFTQGLNGGSIEVVDLRPQQPPRAEAEFNRVKIQSMDFFLQASPQAKYIYGIIDASTAIGDNSFWIHTSGLIEVRLYKIKRAVKLPQSKDISKASILYMIENEAATNAIAITLHADAYARLSADADIVAALAAHPKVSLAKA